jgi:hypothetical protein
MKAPRTMRQCNGILKPNVYGLATEITENGE